MTTLADLTSALTTAGVTRVYKLNAVPASPTYPYAVVGLGSPDKIARTTNGDAADLYRATVQFFGHTHDSVLALATTGDLDGTYIDGYLVERELGTPPYRDPDDSGVLSILHTYRL